MADERPLIDVNAREVEDCGRHPFYRDVQIDFEKAHREALKAYEWLKQRYGSNARR